jgi:uncharacterized protein (DUF1697 family)
VTRYVVLLRGVNVGKARRVPMANLRALLADLGCSDVRTHLNSGNAVVTSDRAERRLATAIEGAVEARLGLTVPVMVRSRDGLAEAIDANPFPDAVTTPSRLLVSFLSGPVDQGRLSAIDEAPIAPDRIAVRGREAYLVYTDGVAGSRLTALDWERRLGVTGTARNWTTVTRLLALADAPAPRSPRS